MLEVGMEVLSVENLRKVISVSSLSTNMSNDFLYEILSMIDPVSPHSPFHKYLTTSPNSDLPIIVESFEVENKTTPMTTDVQIA